MRPPVRGITLRYVSQSGTWPRTGNPRDYVRVPGRKAVAMPDAPRNAPVYLAAYAKAMGHSGAPPVAARPGTIAAAVQGFLASPWYLSRAASTRGQWRRTLDRIREAYGAGKLRDLEARHIQADIGKLAPHPGNNRLKVWRALLSWCCEVALIGANPADTVRRRRVPKTEGFATWTEEDVARFRAHWPLEAPERLAFELLHWTGARMSDAVRMSEGMIGRDGWLTYRQAKTGRDVYIPVRCPAPACAEPEGQRLFLQALEARPERHAVLMVTRCGQPRSIKAASSWFAKAARAAGLEGKSGHGLRKRRANVLGENGATTKQSAAWLGHESLQMVAHYSRGADLRKTIMGTGQEQESSNFPAEVPKGATK